MSKSHSRLVNRFRASAAGTSLFRLIVRFRASAAARTISRLHRPVVLEAPREFDLLSLEPTYTPSAHKIYADLLISELEKSGITAPRSLALTGPYGSGKSSVIAHVKEHFGDRAVSISLPTLGDGVIQEKRDTAQSTTEHQLTKTNVVQKEIVKQLLYIEKPSKMRGSRFQRIAPLRWGVAISASLAVSVAAATVLYSTNSLARIVKLFPDSWISAWTVYLVALLAVAVVVFIAFSAFHNRVSLAEVGSGSASIKLTNSNTNFFDEYLDEIVYFFEKTEVDIVIFEDLDRFNEPHVFETLKELNTLLNGSKQLRRKKTIRFVYAVRDSIFDLRQAAGPNEVGNGSERAKFFGAIVPLVPFITHRSSAALILDVLGESAPESSVLIEIVAAHLTDMRLIKNIRNEWEIFKRRIMSDDGLSGLEPTKLFAMVFYKNLHPADFEKIRSANSLLDVVFRASTELVRQNSVRLSGDVSHFIDRSRQPSAVSRAAELGSELHSLLRQVASHFGISVPHQYQIGGTSFAPEELGSLAFWKRMASARARLTVLYQSNNGYYGSVATSTEFTQEEVSALLKSDIDPARWEEQSRDELDRLTHDAEDERNNLESMTFGELLRSGSNYTVRLDSEDRNLIPDYVDLGTEPISLQALVAALFDSAVVDLLRADIIDLNFTLYTSEFRDAKISASAMTYFIRFVQNDESNLVFAFKDPEDIDSLLRYAGIPAFEARTLYNVQIVDYLLTAGDDHSPVDQIKHLVNTLVAGTPVDRDFVRAFIERSANAPELIREMAGQDRDIFAWLVAEYGNDPSLPRLLSAALSGAGNVSYSTDEQLSDSLARLAPRLPALTRPTEAEASRILALALQRLGVEITDLDTLGETQKDAIVERQLFKITEANLHIAAPDNDLSLDSMRTDQALIDHVIAHIEDYIDVVVESRGTIVSIRQADHFIETLERIQSAAPDSVRRVAELSSSRCRVDSIGKTDHVLWSPLMQANRIRPTFTNMKVLHDGISAGMVESSDLEQWLAGVPVIEPDSTDEATASELRALVLTSTAITPKQKVVLVDQLAAVAPLTPADVGADDSDLVARLVEAGLLPDTAETFDHLRGHPFARASLIERSNSFSSYLSDVELEASDLEAIAGNRSIGDSVRTALLMTTHWDGSATKDVLVKLLGFAREEGSNVQTAILTKAIELGVEPDQVFEVIAQNMHNREAQALNALLTALGGEYAKLAVPGHGTARIPGDAPHRALVGRLQQVGFAGKIASGPSPARTMVVNRKRLAGELTRR